MSKILYLGLELPSELRDKEVVHLPLIRIKPYPKEHSGVVQAFANFMGYTHLIFTSKSAVKIFFEYAAFNGLSTADLNQKKYLSVGKKTTLALQHCGVEQILTASDETAEGMIKLLSLINLDHSFVFWAHSALSRPVLMDWLQAQQSVVAGFKWHACIFYDTVLNLPKELPDISCFEEIIFTSSSTVDAFYTIFGRPSPDQRLTCIGPVTEKHLHKMLELSPCGSYERNIAVVEACLPKNHCGITERSSLEGADPPRPFI